MYSSLQQTFRKWPELNAGIQCTQLLEIPPTKSGKDNKVNPTISSACMKGKLSPSLQADRELTVPSAMTQSPWVQACIRGLLQRTETPILEQRDNTRVHSQKEKPQRSAVYEERLFLDDRQSRAFFPVHCQHQTKNSHRQKLTGQQVHALWVLECLQKLDNRQQSCHLKEYVVRHSASLLQTDLKSQEQQR